MGVKFFLAGRQKNRLAHMMKAFRTCFANAPKNSTQKASSLSQCKTQSSQLILPNYIPSIIFGKLSIWCNIIVLNVHAQSEDKSDDS